ncbi:MAG: hypothetical protein JWO18_3020 [Microbacteriaceae bacterium]|nr:hypothetical protein [Microbacteriaceae bacterium]
MTDPRPRPQYGEYATPQEQAKAVGASAPHFGHAIPPASPPTYSAPPAAKTTPRRWDLVLSTALLAYGLINVFSGFFQFSDLGRLIDGVYATQGVGQFTPTSLSATLGIVINASNVVLWIATAFVTVRLLRRQKLAFYVPLIGGAVASIVAASCLMVLLFSDPAFSAYLNGRG